MSEKTIFVVFSLLLLASVGLAVKWGNPLPLAAPIAAYLGLSFFTHYRYLFFLIFLMIPLSTQFYFTNGLSTDFPSEPFLFYLMCTGILFFALKPESLRKKFFAHPVMIFVILHFVWIIVTVIYSQVFLVSFKFLLAKSWYYATYIFLAGYFIKTKKEVYVFFWCIMTALTIATGYVLIRQTIIGFDFELVGKCMSPFFRNHVNYAVMLVTVLPFLIFLRFSFRPQRIERLIIDVCAIIMIIGVVCAYTRAAYLSFAFIPMAYLMIRYKLSKLLIPIGLIVLGMSFYSLSKDNRYIDFAPDYDSTIYHSNWKDHISATLELKDLSTMERFYRWIAAFSMVKEEPIKGYGPGSFYYFYWPFTNSHFETYVSDNEDKSTVHNYYLLLLTEQGIPGCLLFLGIAITSLLYCEKVYHQTHDRETRMILLAIGSSLLIIYANNFMADLIEVDKIGSLFFINLAILVNLDLSTRQPDRDYELH